MRQYGRGGGAIPGNVISFCCGFFEQLGAHIFKGVFQLDFFGHGHAIMGDGGGAEFAIERHIPPLGAEGGRHSGGNNINSVL